MSAKGVVVVPYIDAPQASSTTFLPPTVRYRLSMRRRGLSVVWTMRAWNGASARVNLLLRQTTRVSPETKRLVW